MAQRRPVEIISDANQWVEGRNAKIGDQRSCDPKDAAYLVGKGRAHYAPKGSKSTDDLLHVGRKKA